MFFSNNLVVGFWVVHVYGQLGNMFAYWIWKKDRRRGPSIAVAYCSLMALVCSMSLFLNHQECSKINTILTLLGILLGCFHPAVLHMVNVSHSASLAERLQWLAIVKLCVVGGTWLALKWVLALFGDMGEHHLCTKIGPQCLMWPVLRDTQAGFWVPGNSVRMILMFGPYFAGFGWTKALEGAFLLVTGPVLADLIASNIQEQASIWSLLSLAQLVVLFVSKWAWDQQRPTTHTGRDSQHGSNNGGPATKSSTHPTSPRSPAPRSPAKRLPRSPGFHLQRSPSPVSGDHDDSAHGHNLRRRV